MKISLGYNRASLFGRYLLKRHVGHGTGSIVWEAYDLEREERVALKEIRKEHPLYLHLIKRVEAEFAVNRALQANGDFAKRNILRIHGILTSTPWWSFWRPKGRVLIMDLLRGEDIRKYTKKKGMTTYNALVLYYTMARALQHMHDCGYVHCDLNPRNVVLHYKNPYLIDFGLSRPIGTRLKLGKLGQNKYMAPEQYLGGELTPRTDVCALARMIYGQLDGPLLDQILKEKDTETGAMRRRIVNPSTQGGPLKREPNLREVQADADAGLADLLHVCMDPDPEKRPDVPTLLGRLAELIQRTRAKSAAG